MIETILTQFFAEKGFTQALNFVQRKAHAKKITGQVSVRLDTAISELKMNSTEYSKFLIEILQNVHLVEEVVSHCSDVIADTPSAETLASDIVSASSISGDYYPEAVSFLSKVIRDLFLIVNSPISADAKSVQNTVISVSQQQKEYFDSKFEEVLAGLPRGEDTIEQALSIVNLIPFQSIEVQKLKEYVASPNKSEKATKLINCFIAVYDNEALPNLLEIDSEIAISESGIALFCTLIAAERYSDARDMASLFNEPLRSESVSLVDYCEGTIVLDDLCSEPNVLKPFSNASIVATALSESAYASRSWGEASHYYWAIAEPNNLVSLTHSRTAKLFCDCFTDRIPLPGMHDESVVVLLDEYLLERPDKGWNETLRRGYYHGLSVAFIFLEEAQIESIYQSLNEDEQRMSYDGYRAAKLDRCKDHELIELFFEVAESVDWELLADIIQKIEKRAQGDLGQVKEYFEEHPDVLKESVSVFSCYVEYLNPQLPAQDYLKYEMVYADNSLFHVLFYKKYSQDMADEAKEHMEKALCIMQQENMPCFVYPEVWAGFLMEANRTDQLIEIATSDPVDIKTLSRILRYCVDQDAFDDDLLPLFEKAAKDPRADCSMLYYAAFFHMKLNNEVEAIHLARRSFGIQQSEGSAHMILSLRLDCARVVDDEVLSFAEDTLTTTMQTMAWMTHKALGNTGLYKQHLVTSILCSGDGDVPNYVEYNRAFPGKEKEELAVVGADSAVTICTKEDEFRFVFHEDAAVVPNGEVELDGYIHLTTKSPIYTALRFKELGKYNNSRWGDYEITAIEPVRTILGKYCFSVMIDIGAAVPYHGIDALLEKMAEIERQPKQEDFYLNGFEVEGGARFYFGIESFSYMTQKNPVEFALQVINTTGFPIYHPTKEGLSEYGDDVDFVLSVNVAVLLSKLDILPETREKVYQRCVLAKQSQTSIMLHITEAIGDLEATDGRLGMSDEEKPFYWKNNLENMQLTAEEFSKVGDFIEAFRVIDVDSFSSRLSSYTRQIISPIARQGILTAKEKVLPYVSEDAIDHMAAQLFEKDLVVVSIFDLFIAFGIAPREFTAIILQLSEMGLTPSMDDQVINYLALETILLEPDHMAEIISNVRKINTAAQEQYDEFLEQRKPTTPKNSNMGDTQGGPNESAE